MLKTSFLIAISKGGVLPHHTPVHDSKCCKGLFSLPLEGRSLTQPISHALLRMLQTSFLIALSKGESYPNKLRCMTLSVVNVISHCHLQAGSLTQPKLQCMTPSVERSFLFAISKEGVLPKQTPMHDSKFCKRDLSLPLERGESYLT